MRDDLLVSQHSSLGIARAPAGELEIGNVIRADDAVKNL